MSLPTHHSLIFIAKLILFSRRFAFGRDDEWLIVLLFHMMMTVYVKVWSCLVLNEKEMTPIVQISFIVFIESICECGRR